MNTQHIWIPVIGLEIHAQIQTKSKMFSPDSTAFQADENSQTHPISLGFPGTLPSLNKQVVESALQVGRAFHCDIQKKSFFARKNYFYPDLPKGYQISQFTYPLLKNGFVQFYSQEKPCKIHIERIHIEEDAGRLLHQRDHSLVDFNRAGMALMEIISHPEISSPQEAADYARMVRLILVSLGVCDGNMQEGSLRFDCNISLKLNHEKKLGTKVEIKNLNSFRFIEKALAFEIKRQKALLEQGAPVHQETRLFNPKKNETFSMRSKEGADDYRYFPEPDLPPLILDEASTGQIPLPALPFDKINFFHKERQLPLSSALILIEDMELCAYFESALKHTQHSQTLCKWVINETQAFLNEQKQSAQNIPIPAKELAELVNQLENKTLSSKMAKELFAKMWKTQKGALALIKELGLKQVSNKEILLRIVEQVISENPEQCLQYQQGKANVYKFLMGQVMKISKGQADPVQAGELIKEKLKSLK